MVTLGADLVDFHLVLELILSWVLIRWVQWINNALVLPPSDETLRAALSSRDIVCTHNVSFWPYDALLIIYIWKACFLKRVLSNDNVTVILGVQF